jgi:hypothetical protein
MKRFHNEHIAVRLLVFALALTSCRKEQRPNVLNTSDAVTSISVTNASTDIQGLQFFVDNQIQLLPDTTLPSGKTSYTLQEIPGVSGNTTKKVPYIYLMNGYRQLNFALPTSRNYIATRNGYFSPNEKYSVFITDSIKHGQAQCVVLKDSLRVPDSAWAQVRFINLSPGTPPMDIYVYYNAGPSGSKLFTGREYLPTHTSTINDAQRFARIRSGPYYFYATISGSHEVLLEGGLILPPGSVTTIFSKGWLYGIGKSALDVGVIRYIQ